MLLAARRASLALGSRGDAANTFLAQTPQVPRKVFAITEETFECPAELSPGGRNLMRAGFRLVDTRTVWQPPEELLHPSTGRLPDV